MPWEGLLVVEALSVGSEATMGTNFAGARTEFAQALAEMD